ncbi:ABC transporter permease [Candidatus Latescibacterota bacterium]
MRALPSLIRKEFLQLRRSRAMIAISIGVPVIQLLLLGFAVSGDVTNVPSAITDLDNSPSSRSLVSRLENSRYLDVIYHPKDISDGHALLKKGKAILAVTIPKDFERLIVRGEKPEISLLADAQNSNVAVTGAGYVRRIIISWVQTTGVKKIPTLRRILNDRSMRTSQINTITTETGVWYNPEMKSLYYMVPGIMVILLTVVTIMLTAMAIVREREMGTLEQLMVTTISRTELILGKTIPFAIIGMIELFVSMGVIRFVYDIPIRGPLVDFLLMTVVFLFCTLGIGIFISTITSTQQQALFTAWFTIVFCILMSGILLPMENMPDVMLKISTINPLRYYATIVRSLFLKGSGFADLKNNVLAMGVIASVVLTASVIRFAKKVD